MIMKEALQKKATETRKRSAGVTSLHSAPSPGSLADRVAVLQQRVGNHAVQRLFESGIIQAKLRIGQPNDIYEQEADRVADQVMRMAEPGIQRKPG
jgi:hypothetical protein